LDVRGSFAWSAIGPNKDSNGKATKSSALRLGE
jgi:hypothetical protein